MNVRCRKLHFNVIWRTLSLLLLVGFSEAWSLQNKNSGEVEPAAIRGEEPQDVVDVLMPEVEGVTVETWVTRLHIPWSLIFLPNGDALVSERRGSIQRIPKGQSEPELYTQLDVAHVGDSGLMGLALHPQFAEQSFVYAMHSYRSNKKLFTRIIRLRHAGNQGILDRTIFDGMPAAKYHVGGRIGFGPDGMLYIGTGDVNEADLSQDPKSLAGKILRITPEGEIPEDNPLPGSPIFSLGHRTVQGLTWDPRTNTLFNSDHGPSGERKVNRRDEINIVKKGGNYGWPKVVGAPAISGYQDPVVMWKKQGAPPSGIAFYRDDLYVATLGSQALIRIVFDREAEDPFEIKRIERWFCHKVGEGTYGRLRDVTPGPDGHLYVLTSNTDGRAPLRSNDDKILRLKFSSEGQVPNAKRK